MERRQSSVVKEYVVPIIASVASAVCTGYLTLQIALTTIETKLIYVEADLSDIKVLMKNISENQVELSKRGVWMSNTERRLQDIELKIHRLPTQKDIDLIMTKIEMLKK